jgi:hypothetical protein
LRLASELLGANVPSELQDEPWPAATGALCAEAIAALRLPAGVFQDRWIERRAHRAAFDRWFDRMAYDVWRLIAPTPLEWQWRRLPDAWRWLYVPMRIVRLAAAGARGALRGSTVAVSETGGLPALDADATKRPFRDGVR